MNKFELTVNRLKFWWYCYNCRTQLGSKSSHMHELYSLKRYHTHKHIGNGSMGVLVKTLGRVRWRSSKQAFNFSLFKNWPAVSRHSCPHHKHLEWGVSLRKAHRPLTLKHALWPLMEVGGFWRCFITFNIFS